MTLTLGNEREFGAGDVETQATLIHEAQEKIQEIHQLLQPVFDEMRAQGLEIITSEDKPDLREYLLDNDPYFHHQSAFEMGGALLLFIPHIFIQLTRQFLYDHEELARTIVSVTEALEKRKNPPKEKQEPVPFGTTLSFTTEKRQKFTPLAAEAKFDHPDYTYFAPALGLMVYVERPIFEQKELSDIEIDLEKRFSRNKKTPDEPIQEKVETYHMLAHIIPGNQNGKSWGFLVEHLPTPGPYSTETGPHADWLRDTFGNTKDCLAGVKQYLAEFLNKTDSYEAYRKELGKI